MEKSFHTYEPEVLQKLQRVQLEILKDFIALCEKYELDYFMLGGSGIGTVRHQGFIPWDDDIDVAMPRKHYEVLTAAVEREMGDKYRILTPLSDRRYSCNVTHMQKKGTKFVPEVAKDMEWEMCIDIDIFPLDHVADDPKKRRQQFQRTWLLNKLLFLRGNGAPLLPLNGWKKHAAALICRCVHLVLKGLRISPQWLYRRLRAEQMRYNKEKSRCLCTFEVPMANRAWITKRELYPLREMPFEGLTVKMPNDYDRYLTRVFGDYRQLPPKEKRVNHCPYLLDFGEDDGE